MRSLDLPCCPLLRRLRQWVGILPSALLTIAAGCAEFRSSGSLADPIVRGVEQSVGELPRVLPPPNSVPQAEKLQPKAPPSVGHIDFTPLDPTKMVPLSLDTVLRLAESQNGQTSIAREKLREAFANQELAEKAWLPDLWIGTGWYRHDGGIADFEGNLLRSSFGTMFAGAELNGRMDLREATYRKVQASRQVWQQRAKVSKLSAEALLEASSTYVDMMAARAAESIAVQIESHLRELLDQASTLAKTMPSGEVEVARIQADFHGQQQLTRKFREASVVAAAKLIYLMGLDPASELAIMDRSLVAFTLVDAEKPGQELVAMAEQNGPGIREVAGLLQTIQEANAQANGPAAMLPVFDLRVAEGGFGSGPGGTMDWADRFDLGLQLRWNITDWCTRREQQRLRHAQMSQAHLTFHDVRAKLTLGVQEAREIILSSRDQMNIGQHRLAHASDALERSKFRFAQAPIKDRSANDVLLAIRALNASNLAYLLSIRDHDKAQLRLAILTGMIGGRCE